MPRQVRLTLSISCLPSAVSIYPFGNIQDYNQRRKKSSAVDYRGLIVYFEEILDLHRVIWVDCPSESYAGRMITGAFKRYDK